LNFESIETEQRPRKQQSRLRQSDFDALIVEFAARGYGWIEQDEVMKHVLKATLLQWRGVTSAWRRIQEASGHSHGHSLVGRALSFLT